MCDVRRQPLFAALVLLCGTGVAAQAQDLAAERARLARIRAELRAEEERSRFADSVRVAGIPVDTARAGTLTVLSPSGVPASLRAGTAGAWRDLEQTFGRETRVLDSLQFVLGIRGAPQVTARIPPLRVRGIGLAGEPDSAALHGILASAAALTITEAQDPALAQWLGARLNPEPGLQPWRLADAYVELATEPWTVVTRCFAGDDEGCRRTLGLVAGEDYLDQWYDPEDRRRVVDAVAGPAARRTPQENACVVGGSISACTAVLRQDGRTIAPPPVSGALRATVVQLALEFGGPGAYERLIANAGRPMPDRLAAAATVPSDSLIHVWRARTIAARPAPVTLQPAGAWAAFAWVAVLAAIALRSSRWR